MQGPRPSIAWPLPAPPTSPSFPLLPTHAQEPSLGPQTWVTHSHLRAPALDDPGAQEASHHDLPMTASFSSLRLLFFVSSH